MVKPWVWNRHRTGILCQEFLLFSGYCHLPLKLHWVMFRLDVQQQQLLVLTISTLKLRSWAHHPCAFVCCESPKRLDKLLIKVAIDQLDWKFNKWLLLADLLNLLLYQLFDYTILFLTAF